MNLLQSELVEHKKILDAFRQLPKDIKKYILEFHRSWPHSWGLPHLGSSNAILICPICYEASYKVLICEGGCFICDHNYYKMRLCLREEND